MAKKAEPSRVAAALQYLQQMRDRAADFGGGVVDTLADRARDVGGLAYEAFTSDPNIGRMTTAEYAQAADRPTPRLDQAAQDLGTIGKAIVTQPVQTGKALVQGEVERARQAMTSPRAAGEYAGSMVDPMRIAAALRKTAPIAELEVYHGTPLERDGHKASPQKIAQPFERGEATAMQINPSVVKQALGKEFPKIDETTGNFFYPDNQSIVISQPNFVGNYGRNLNIERKIGNGKIRLTAKIENMPFHDEPSRMTTALEALGDVPRGTGAATEMYLEALAIAQAQGVGFASESIRSNAAENIYRRLIKKGVPFKQGVGMDKGSWVLSADDLRRLDFSKLKDN